MKFFKRIVIVSFFLFSAVIYSNAQNQMTEPAPIPPDYSQCDSALLDRANYVFRLRDFRCNFFEVESLLKKILAICPNAPFLFETRKKLALINEDKAQKNLYIANYYLKKFREKKSGLKGSQARLKQITEDFPEFSKIDEVTFLLAETYFLDKQFKDAEKWYQKMIRDFPNSKFADKARLRIEQTERIREFKKN